MIYLLGIIVSEATDKEKMCDISSDMWKIPPWHCKKTWLRCHHGPYQHFYVFDPQKKIYQHYFEKTVVQTRYKITECCGLPIGSLIASGIRPTDSCKNAPKDACSKDPKASTTAIFTRRYTLPTWTNACGLIWVSYHRPMPKNLHKA